MKGGRSALPTPTARQAGPVRLASDYPADGVRSMTDSGVDYYAVLGVSRQASAAEIVRAYRRQLRRIHPDTRPSADAPAPGEATAEPAAAGESVALLREAFAVLGDPTRRTEYDRRTRPLPHPRLPSREPPSRAPYLAGPPDPPLRAGPVHYRPNPPRAGI